MIAKKVAVAEDKIYLGIIAGSYDYLKRVE